MRLTWICNKSWMALQSSTKEWFNSEVLSFMLHYEWFIWERMDGGILIDQTVTYTV